MTPKPIIRKTGGEENLPPVEETRSALSIGLERMKAKQDEAFRELSDNGRKMYDAIRAMDRYVALTGPSGQIASEKDFISVTQAKMAAAINEFMACIDDSAQQIKAASVAMSEISQKIHEHAETGSADGTEALWKAAYDVSTKLRAEDAKVIGAARALASVSLTLSKQVKRLLDFEQELEALEPVVASDEIMPDFQKLKDTPSRKAVEADSGEAAKSMQVNSCFVTSNEEATEEEIAKRTSAPGESCDPILWQYFFESMGTVMALTRDGARQILALRIKNSISPEQFNVWREDAEGNRLTDDGKPARIG